MQGAIYLLLEPYSIDAEQYIVSKHAGDTIKYCTASRCAVTLGYLVQDVVCNSSSENI